jgi:hypothetical protein
MCANLTFLNAQLTPPTATLNGSVFFFNQLSPPAFVNPSPIQNCELTKLDFPYTYVDASKKKPVIDVKADLFLESPSIIATISNGWVLQPNLVNIGINVFFHYIAVVEDVPSGTFDATIFQPITYAHTTSGSPQLVVVSYSHGDASVNNWEFMTNWQIFSASTTGTNVIPNGTISSTFNAIGYAALRSNGCSITDPGGYQDYIIDGTYTINEEICFNPLLGVIPRNLLLSPGAEIIVASGGSLTISGSSIRSCSQMARGITVRAGGTLTLLDNSIRDCQFAVNAEPGSFIYIRGNTFTNNFTAINANFASSNFFFKTIEDNTFTSDASIKDGYPGMANNVGSLGYSGISLSNVEGFFLSSSNNFTSLANGIVGRNSNLSIFNQTFTNMVNDNSYGSIAGYGIHAASTGNNLKRLVIGNATSFNTFAGCGVAAVYARKMSGRISSNFVTTSQSGFLWHDSKNTKIQIDGNIITVNALGISSLMNEPLLNASTVGITTNTITSPRGIRSAESGGVADRGWLIEGNTITPTEKEAVGIYYARGVSGKVQGNVIGVDFENSIGIQMENTKNAYCGVNNLDGTDNSVGTAILATGNRSPYLQCNNSNLINTGIQVMDLNEGGVVETNSFNNYKVGLQYTGSTMMPPQLHRGNCWDNANGNAIDASNESTLDADNSRYIVDLPPSLGEMACYMPTNQEPDGWFKKVETPEVTLTCSALPPTGGFSIGKDEWDIKVATHTWQPEKYTESTLWRAEYRLYQKLLANPSLTVQNIEFSNFKTEKTGSNIDKLVAIENIKQGLYKLSASEQDQLQTLTDQRDTKADKFNLAHDAYVSNPSIGKTEVNSSWAILQTKNAALESVLNAQQLVRVSQVTYARGLNNQLNASSTCEKNQIAVNEIYLRSVAENTDFFNNEITQLQSIAEQCPYEGGDAVYEARAILGFLDEKYDDRKLCNVEGLKPKSLERGKAIEQSQKASGLIYPNPVNDLLYLNTEIMGASIRIFDNVGILAYEADNVQSPISVVNFQSGVYRIEIKQVGKRSIFQKFIVTKF